jgi:hypothetical protein
MPTEESSIEVKGKRKVNPLMRRAKNPHFTPYQPLSTKRRVFMTQHCVVLLPWAAKNGQREVSLTIIANETNIPRMSIRWILENYFECGPESVISRAARSCGYDFKIYRTWNKDDKFKRKKKIIESIKRSEQMEKDY